MTRIVNDRYGERYYIEANGHAVYDEEFAFTGELEGENESIRVCAAVSILMLAVAARLQEMEKNGDFIHSCITVEGGYALFDIEPRYDCIERLEEIIEVLMSGLSLLEEAYPGLVTVE